MPKVQKIHILNDKELNEILIKNASSLPLNNVLSALDSISPYWGCDIHDVPTVFHEPFMGEFEVSNYCDCHHLNMMREIYIHHQKVLRIYEAEIIKLGESKNLKKSKRIVQQTPPNMALAAPSLITSSMASYSNEELLRYERELLRYRT